MLTDDGEVLVMRIATAWERFSSVRGTRAPARVLLEASTESEWVTRRLKGQGHRVQGNLELPSGRPRGGDGYSHASRRPFVRRTHPARTWGPRAQSCARCMRPYPPEPQ